MYVTQIEKLTKQVRETAGVFVIRLNWRKTLLWKEGGFLVQSILSVVIFFSSVIKRKYLVNIYMSWTGFNFISKVRGGGGGLYSENQRAITLKNVINCCLSKTIPRFLIDWHEIFFQWTVQSIESYFQFSFDELVRL